MKQNKNNKMAKGKPNKTVCGRIVDNTSNPYPYYATIDDFYNVCGEVTVVEEGQEANAIKYDVDIDKDEAIVITLEFVPTTEEIGADILYITKKNVEVLASEANRYLRYVLWKDGEVIAFKGNATCGLCTMKVIPGEVYRMTFELAPWYNVFDKNNPGHYPVKAIVPYIIERP